MTKPFAKQPAKGDLVLPGATVHLAGKRASKRLGYSDSGRRRGQEAADQVRRFRGGGVHQEDGIVSRAIVLSSSVVGSSAPSHRNNSVIPAEANEFCHPGWSETTLSSRPKRSEVEGPCVFRGITYDYGFVS